MSTFDADVIVLGLGVHGSATVAQLARRGVNVIGIDQFAPGHSRGSSHGRTRMIRRAYPNPVWNDLVARAFDGWAELERESGETLIHRTGGMYAHRGDAQLQGPDCELVEDRDRMRELMPSFAVPEGYRAVYDPSAGVTEAERALAAMRSSGVSAGAELRWGVRASGWESRDGGVTLRTDDGELRARRLVITGGSWMSTLVPELEQFLEVWRILTLTVAPGQAVGMPPSLGAFSVARDAGLMFCIPDAAGNGVKVGVDAGLVWDPNRPADPPTKEETQELQELMQTHIPGIDTSPAELAACLYTMTKDMRFILGSLSRAPEVIVGSACSGHSFKLSPAIGEALADLATGVPRPDLEFISTARRGI